MDTQVEMKKVTINGEFEIILPKHRADRPEWYTEKGWEKARLQSMHTNLGDGDTIFYVGSEEGEMPALCQMWGARVVMFEPNDLVWPNAAVIWSANKLKAPLAVISGFAANETSEQVPVIRDGFPESARGKVISDHGFKELAFPGSIPMIKIDDLVESQPNMQPSALSIDVEGSEWEVLQGAQKTIESLKPKIWLSVHPEFMFDKYKKYSYEVRQWITDRGYVEHYLDYQHEAHFYYAPN